MKKNTASAFSNFLAKRMATNSAAATASIAMPASMMSPNKSKNTVENASAADDLIRRLVNLELIIEKLFSLPNASEILERKISQLEEMIAEFPGGAEKTADGWRDKVVSLWQRLSVSEAMAAYGHHSANLAMISSPSRSSKMASAWKSLLASPKSSMSKKTSKQVELPPLGATVKISKQEKLDQQQQMQAPAAAQRTSKSPALLATPTESQIALALSELNKTPRRNSDETQKQALRVSLENSLSNLADISSGADVDAVKQLLTEVARAQHQLANYSADTRLHFDVFNFAFRKLPTKMREQFLTIYGVRQNGINLKNLVAFLQAEIVAQHSKTVWLLSMIASKKPKEGDSGGGGSSSNGHQNNCSNGGQGNSRRTLIGPVPLKWSNAAGKSAANAGNYCKYCKSIGHTPTGCPYIKELLCFQCYQYGHTKKTCTNKPML